MNPDDFSSQELADALQRLPSLAVHAQAARQLVISHRYWLRRLEFRAAIEVEVYCGLVYAHIDWHAASVLVDELTASESECAVLRFACLLVGQGPAPADDERWSLRVMLGAVADDQNTFQGNASLMLTAFATALTGSRL
jgi:hypothetical protein